MALFESSYQGFLTHSISKALASKASMRLAQCPHVVGAYYVFAEEQMMLTEALVF